MKAQSLDRLLVNYTQVNHPVGENVVMSNNETIFLTGFPGFIAGRLLRRLASRPFKFLLLVQPRFVELARQQLQDLADEGATTSEFFILEGDIAETGLALAAEELEIAQRQTTILFHLAALYDLGVPRELAMRVNVEGTRNVNQFARSISKLSHYHYISTCYVAGKRQGPIFETELEHGAGFRNYYEESKYLAEIEVENLKSQLPVTIHRPAVVCGDSVTGATAKYDGIYYLIRYLLRLPRVLSLFNIGNQEVSLNLVPVDFVVAALAALLSEPRAIGKTVQLADPYPLTTYELFNEIAQHIIGSQSLLTLPAGLVEWSLMLPGAPVLTHLPHHAVPYFFINQTYETFESSRLLGSHDIHCPAFTSYVGAIVDYAAKHPVPGG